MSETKKPDGDLPFLSRWAKRKIAAKDVASDMSVSAAHPTSVRPDPSNSSGQGTLRVSKGMANFNASISDTGGASIPQHERRELEDDPLVNTSTGEHFEAKTPETPQPEAGLANEADTPAALPPIESLTHEADFTPFMARDVDPALRNQAMKKLFADPHYGFDKMDKLDIYIDDYSKPDPIPLEMLKMMYQSKSLFLFADEEKEDAKVPAPNAEESTRAKQPTPPETSAALTKPETAAARISEVEPGEEKRTGPIGENSGDGSGASA